VLGGSTSVHQTFGLDHEIKYFPVVCSDNRCECSAWTDPQTHSWTVQYIYI